MRGGPTKLRFIAIRKYTCKSVDINDNRITFAPLFLVDSIAFVTSASYALVPLVGGKVWTERILIPMAAAELMKRSVIELAYKSVVETMERRSHLK